jgi:guanylate kinase
MASEQGILIVVSGPSGVGKGTLCRRLMEFYGQRAFLSVSCTTRRIGNAEADGENYWFIDKQEFETRIAENGFIEYADVFGNYYGTPRKPVEDALAAGRIVILEIDVQGGLQVKKQYPQAAMIFVLPPRAEDLLVRIEGRQRGEDEQSKKRRLETAMQEVNTARGTYEYFVVNDVLERAVEEMKTIVRNRCPLGQ